MNETSQTSRSGRNGSSRERPRVRPLEHRDARVVPELRVQLAVADVDRDHARDAVLEQAVGEPAGRCADVDRIASVELDLEPLERVRELLAAAGDERAAAGRPRARRPPPPGDPACRSPGTSPASTSACACARLSASPRSTSRTSRRFFTAKGSRRSVTRPSWNCAEIASSYGRSRRRTSTARRARRRSGGRALVARADAGARAGEGARRGRGVASSRSSSTARSPG